MDIPNVEVKLDVFDVNLHLHLDLTISRRYLLCDIVQYI